MILQQIIGKADVIYNVIYTETNHSLCLFIYMNKMGIKANRHTSKGHHSYIRILKLKLQVTLVHLPQARYLI